MRTRSDKNFNREIMPKWTLRVFVCFKMATGHSERIYTPMGCNIC